MAFVETMDFARIHVFPYSRRHGTPAADFPLQVPEGEKKRRAEVLGKLAEQKAAAFENRFLGQTMEVLVETTERGVTDGLTGNYIRVYAKADGSQAGQIQNYRLEKLYRDGVWGAKIG
jgi:threonylcarbamoyladenosine tRNA methylthiotransferase MtaB